MRTIPPLVSSVVLALLCVSQGTSVSSRASAQETGDEPALEKRIAFGPESAGQWVAAESRVEASTRRTWTGQPVLHWHIMVDHFGGEVNYFSKIPVACRGAIKSGIMR